MTGNFFESETKENLMRAFAGESQARNRYTIAAEKAREKGMYTIADGIQQIRSGHMQSGFMSC